MRYIELKELQTRKKELVLNYKQQIALIVGEVYETNQGRGQGFDRDTNKRAMRVLDALDEQGGDILALEDADHQFLLARVNGFVWPFADSIFEIFCSDIEQAPAKKPEALAATV